MSIPSNEESARSVNRVAAAFLKFMTLGRKPKPEPPPPAPADKPSTPT